jgi:ribosomal protein S18 acetylase RimI-like enzyme
MIRPAIPADTPMLVQLTAATGVFKHHEVDVLREILEDFHAGDMGEHHIAIVCEHEGQAVGYAYYAPDVMTDGAWYIYWIAVSPTLHGKGVGREILLYAEDDIRRRNGRVLFIETSSQPSYETTRRFYLRQGYAVTGVLRDFYTDGDDMVIFRKRMRGEDRPTA